MEEGYVEVVNRKGFYKDGMRRMFGLLLALCSVAVVLGLSVLYLLTNKPQPTYFAVDEAGSVTPLQPLSQPLVSPSSLTNWATNAIISVFSYDYFRYKTQLNDAQKYFSPNGWTEFLSGMKASGRLSSVVDQKLLVSAVPTGSAVVTAQGLVGNRYSWRIQLPILVTYEGPGETRSQSLIVNVQISRISTYNNPQGIAIEKFVSTGEKLK